VLFALQGGLRSGEVWVEGSRRYANPASYLIAPETWPTQRAEVLELTAMPATFADRLAVIDQEMGGYLDDLEALLTDPDSPVRVDEHGELHLSPLDAEVDVDLDACRIRVTQGKGAKGRVVPFPPTFRETLSLHMGAQQSKGAAFLFESNWKKPYSTRPGAARPLRQQGRPGTQHAPTPATTLPLHLAQDPRPRRRPDPAIQRPHQSQITRVYSRLSLADAQDSYDQVIGRFPV